MPEIEPAQEHEINNCQPMKVALYFNYQYFYNFLAKYLHTEGFILLKLINVGFAVRTETQSSKPPCFFLPCTIHPIYL